MLSAPQDVEDGVNNEDNEVKRQSEDKIEQYDNEDYNEEIPISK